MKNHLTNFWCAKRVFRKKEHKFQSKIFDKREFNEWMKILTAHSRHRESVHTYLAHAFAGVVHHLAQVRIILLQLPFTVNSALIFNSFLPTFSFSTKLISHFSKRQNLLQHHKLLLFLKHFFVIDFFLSTSFSNFA